MYEEFTAKDFRTFKHWLAFVKEISRDLPCDYVLWYVNTHRLVIDIPDDDGEEINNADRIIAKYVTRGVLV